MASVYEAFEVFHTILHVKWTLGDDFMIVSVFSAELGSTSDTCTSSFYGAFEEAPFFSSWCLWEMTSGCLRIMHCVSLWSFQEAHISSS